MPFESLSIKRGILAWPKLVIENFGNVLRIDFGNELLLMNARDWGILI